MRLDITGRHVDDHPAAPAADRPDARQARARAQRQRRLGAGHRSTKEKYRHTDRDGGPRARRSHAAAASARATPGRSRSARRREKIEQQAQKLKGKWDRAQAAGGRAARGAAPRRAGGAAAADGAAVVRATRYAVKPMSVEDAALRVDERPPTRSSCSATRTTDAVSILYRRKDGNLGLIEPD